MPFQQVVDARCQWQFECCSMCLPVNLQTSDCCLLVEVNAKASDDTKSSASAPVAWMTSLNCPNPCITHSCKPLSGLVYTIPLWLWKPLLNCVLYLSFKTPAPCNLQLLLGKRSYSPWPTVQLCPTVTCNVSANPEHAAAPVQL